MTRRRSRRRRDTQLVRVGSVHTSGCRVQPARLAGRSTANSDGDRRSRRRPIGTLRRHPARGARGRSSGMNCRRR